MVLETIGASALLVALKRSSRASLGHASEEICINRRKHVQCRGSRPWRSRGGVGTRKFGILNKDMLITPTPPKKRELVAPMQYGSGQMAMSSHLLLHRLPPSWMLKTPRRPACSRTLSPTWVLSKTSCEPAVCFDALAFECKEQ